MAPPLPPDTAVAGWLYSLGVVSRCQGEVLICLSLQHRPLLAAPHRKAFTQLQALAGHRAGRVLVAQQWRWDDTPDETRPPTKRLLADASKRLHVHPRAALKRVKRRP